MREGAYTIDNFSITGVVTGNQPVNITTQPTNQVANQGDNVTLVVVATGSNPQYQWFKGQQPTGVLIPGATSSSYVITNAQPPGDTYYCTVANAVPSSQTSQDAVITVNADTTAPSIVAALGQRDQLTVLVSFSEKIKSPSFLDIHLTEKVSGTPVGITNAIVQNGTNLLIEQDSPRKVGTNYALAFDANSVFDINNNSIAPTNICPLAQEVLLIKTDNQAWKYQADGVDQGTGWIMPLFDDSAWSNGLSCFDAKNTGPRVTVGTPAQTVRTHLSLTNAIFPVNDIPTFYFRAHFHFPGLTNGATVTIRTMWDDGGYLWLNGQLAKALRVDAGPGMTNQPFAMYGVQGGPADPIPFEGPNPFPLTNVVQNGDNVLALELKQQAVGSSDITMTTEILGHFPSFVYASSGPLLTLVPDPGDPGFADLAWSGAGTLQSSPDLITWTDVGGNPHALHVNVTGGVLFYRVRP